MSVEFDRQVVDEVARRAARRLAILGEERPDLLAERLAVLDTDTLSDLLQLSRLPGPLANREPRRRHFGVEGVDHCTNRLLVRKRAGAGPPVAALCPAELTELDDEDLLAARRYIPETLPGNVLG
jgi:hypothetical protein